MSPVSRNAVRISEVRRLSTKASNAASSCSLKRTTRVSFSSGLYG
jgi:hypothetical protein